MAIWFQIAIALNVIYWAVFIYLLSRHRRDAPALAIGIFHMLFAAVVSVAPIRSFLDPAYTGYGLGIFHFEKRAVVIPASLVLGWALAAAWVTAGQGRGRWMRLVMVGDLFFALNLSVSILLDGRENWKFQLGEHFAVTGAAGLFTLLCFFALPFAASAVWAASRTRADGTAPPLATSAEGKGEDSTEEGKDNSGFRYSATRA